MKKISIYVKGDRNSTAYYRIYQYFDRIDGINAKYNIMYPSWVQHHFMPVSQQCFPIKAIVYIASYFSVLYSLIQDVFDRPQTIVIHKRLISRWMPYSFKFVMRFLVSHGSTLCWDFDDHIVKGGEISQKSFNFLAEISSSISVTHDYLKQMVPQVYHKKVVILPTTDGDLYLSYQDEFIHKTRLESYGNKLILIWVATSSNLSNLYPFIPYIDEGARRVKQDCGKQVILRIVCDKPLICKTETLVVDNIKWTRKNAIEEMKTSHVGIMPLLDTEYNKGKGGFKLVQYISIGLPSIGSSVGFNKNVLGDDCGILCDTPEDWVEAVVLMNQYDSWKRYSEESFKFWNKNFSYEKNLNYWKKTIKEL